MLQHKSCWLWPSMIKSEKGKYFKEYLISGEGHLKKRLFSKQWKLNSFFPLLLRRSPSSVYYNHFRALTSYHKIIKFKQLS